MKVYNINSRMPYTAVLEEVSSENDKKVRRFRLGHLLFTLQLHSLEIEDFDKKSLDEKEEAIKKALPRKVRQSLEKPNHSYDSDAVKQMRETAKMIKATTTEIIRREIDAEEAAEKPAAPVTQPAPQPQASAETAAAIMGELRKFVDEMLAKASADQAPAENQQQPDGDPNANTQAPANQPADSMTPPTDPALSEIGKLKKQLDDLTAEITSADEAVKAASKEDRNKLQCKLNALNQKRARLIEQIAAAAIAAV